MTSALIVLTALTFDALWGEVRRWHPLVGFGQLASAIEQRLYQPRRAVGAVAVVVAVLPFVAVAAWLESTSLAPWCTAVLLYLAIGWKSLSEHALPIAEALDSGDVAQARAQLSRIVSRDTENLDEQGIARAAVESVLENGCDAIYGAIFWALVLGAPGVVLYRLVNTLDAMWGYKSERYLQFGWAAARLDDLLNYVPARLTALAYALAGNTSRALRCWRRQGHIWKSPNAGPVMAAGAGSLGVLLGGSAQYHGSIQARPDLGEARAPIAQDIRRSLRLVNRVVVIWLTLLLLASAIANPPF